MTTLQDLNPLDLLSFSGKKRVPLIMQAEVSECGLASLAMISSYYGARSNVATFRKFQTLSAQGMSLKQIMGLANETGLISRALRCELNEVGNLKLPCVLHWDLDHFVVLTGISNQWFYINDPALGKRKLSLAEFSRSFTGIALELTPCSSFKKKDSRLVMKMSQLWSKIEGLKRSLVSLFLLSLILQTTALISPYYMQWVIDSVLLSNDKALLIVLALGFSILTIIKIVVAAFRSWLVLRISNVLNIQMGANLFRHLIRLPIRYFENRHVGDVVSRFGSLNAIRELITTGVVEATIDGIMAITILVVMYLYNPVLASIAILFVLMLFLTQMFFYFPNRRITEESIVANANEDTHFLESIRAVQTIKLFNHETHRQNVWLNRYAEVINADIRLGKLNITEDSLIGLLLGLESIFIIYFGALNVMDGGFTVGMLLAFIAYKGQFTTSINAFIGKMFSFKLLGLHLERLSDITLEQQEEFLCKATLPKCIKGSIKIEKLSYRYADNLDWVIKDLSFEVRSGECVAITGESGCGKTTLMKLILGLLKPSSGTIYLDGVNIQDLSLNDYRQLLGSVTQDDILLTGTLSENITMFDSDYDENKVIACCQAACIWNEIALLPMGLNSLVGDMGSSFSGGQLQRIFLARALYKEPNILCLDESTSHLDANNEVSINKNLDDLNVTKIIIAHRYETINSADRVINLK
ncbi:peptidase domain-containing ABC transporter [Vibrio splendidus]|uniref:peptidase domain-containing ABC transporter n=1 Tax=Vibrio TaxID=662 RepID=UPI000066FC7F|nr:MULTISPECIES: peptidase domain-containing ABC transporter [Vibrio]EAP95640.1 putative toxin transporter [Vibrio splendidus 12B01]PMJ63173.1 ABC transporter ATP-binding protein [Vibrio lentus]